MKPELLFAAIVIAVWLVLLLTVCMTAFARVRSERQHLRLAIEPSAVEVPRFLLLGIIPGVAISGMLTVFGLASTWPVVITLTGVTLMSALIPRFFSPLVYGVAGVFGLLVRDVLPSGMAKGGSATGFALLLTFMMLFALVADLGAPYHVSPRILRSHGRRRLQSRVWQLIFLPLVVPVPGTFVQAAPFLKLLSPSIGGVSFTLLPVVLGFGLHTFGDVRARLRRRAILDGILMAAALVGTVLGFAGVVSDTGLVWFIGGVAVLLLGTLLLTPDNEQDALTDAPGGVRVVAVIPGTPAAKMGLHTGDTILQCNGADVPNARAFYNATQQLGTFCRLRVRGSDGRFRLAETAIFAGAPHMLGVITFPEETKS